MTCQYFSCIGFVPVEVLTQLIFNVCTQAKPESLCAHISMHINKKMTHHNTLMDAYISKALFKMLMTNGCFLTVVVMITVSSQ